MQRGEPIYGPRDVPDLPAIAALGRPFWLAGSYGDPQRVLEALGGGRGRRAGGHGLRLLQRVGTGPGDSAAGDRVESSRLRCDVKTDPLASPTGFPFKVRGTGRLDLGGGRVSTAASRVRPGLSAACLQEAADGTIGWRCGCGARRRVRAQGGQTSRTRRAASASATA